MEIHNPFNFNDTEGNYLKFGKTENVTVGPSYTSYINM